MDLCSCSCRKSFVNSNGKIRFYCLIQHVMATRLFVQATHTDCTRSIKLTNCRKGISELFLDPACEVRENCKHLFENVIVLSAIVTDQGNGTKYISSAFQSRFKNWHAAEIQQIPLYAPPS